VLKALADLPPFSPVLSKLLASLSTDDVAFGQLAKLIERDAGEFRFGLAPSGRQDHAPMGRSERLVLSVNGPRQRLHPTGLAKWAKEASQRE